MRGSLIPLYKDIVAAGSHNFYGLSIVQHAREIGCLMQRYGATSAIDVGCGRGDQYADPIYLHKQWGLDSIYMYDPAFEEHDTLPNGATFDAVLCSDVLEHVPEPEVDDFIANLFRLSTKFVWASVCCRLAKKRFPDANKTNMHVTVKPYEWWSNKFDEISRQTDLFREAKPIPFYLIETP